MSEYEYRGMIAKAWDFLRGDTTLFSDRQFHLDVVAENGDPALVVGCGTGRVLFDLVDIGLDAEGLDVSPEMLAICKEKAREQSIPVTVYEQPMEEMALKRQYQTILVPSMSFHLVTDLSDAKRTLNNFYKYLLPGGTLVLTAWHIKKDGQMDWGNWWLVQEKDGFEDGKSIKRWERSRFDATTQLRHAENRYELWQDDEVVFTELHRRSPELRNYSLNQLVKMVEDAGFSGVHATSEFSSTPASEEDHVFCVFGKKVISINK